MTNIITAHGCKFALEGEARVLRVAMTLYSILLQASGLSQREAADFHAVRIDTVKNWCRGAARPPEGVIAELKGLIRRQRIAADELAAGIAGSPADAVELGLASDDAEAQAPPRGWPCVSAQAQALGLAVAQADKPVRIVPRGSTPATAGAAGAHEATSDPRRRARRPAVPAR
jgi:hypothetical protein